MIKAKNKDQCKQNGSETNYTSDKYKARFELESTAIKKLKKREWNQIQGDYINENGSKVVAKNKQ